MKTSIKAAIGAIALTLVTVVYAATCGIDNSTMTFTGKTRTEMGKVLKEFKCALGHVSWFAD